MKLIKFKSAKKKTEKIKTDDQLIEIRDLREKFYMVDDAYLNGMARKCGIYATGVYNVLCRHAGSDQSCFPSVTLISDKLHVSIRQVRRAIKILESCKIIKVERRCGGHNKYWLINKSEWRRPRVKEFYKIGNLRPATRKERMKLTR